jgi:hypothetical protein
MGIKLFKRSPSRQHQTPTEQCERGAAGSAPAVVSATAFSNDRRHFQGRISPAGLVGDGADVVSLCCNRGHYFLLTGEKIAPSVAKMLGLVGKVLPHDKVLSGAC